MPRSAPSIVTVLISGLLIACGGSDSSSTKPPPIAASPASSTPTTSTPIPTQTAENTTARFTDPSDITVDSFGNLYVLDNGAIRKIALDGSVKTIVPRPDTAAPITGDQVAKIYKITNDRDGNFYVLDANTVKKITSAGAVATVASGVDKPGPCGGDAFGPSAIAVDGSGNVYVADADNHEINMIAPNGEITTVLKGNHSCTAIGDGILRPSVIAFDKAGGMYIGDVRGVSKVVNGHAIPITGPGTTACCHPDVYLTRTAALTIDSAGNLYTIDEPGIGMHDDHHHRVIKISNDGSGKRLAGSSWTTGPSARDGQGDDALFLWPKGIVASPDGNVYVADTGNKIVRRITPNGLVTTIAEVAGEVGTSN